METFCENASFFGALFGALFGTLFGACSVFFGDQLLASKSENVLRAESVLQLLQRSLKLRMANSRRCPSNSLR